MYQIAGALCRIVVDFYIQCQKRTDQKFQNQNYQESSKLNSLQNFQSMVGKKTKQFMIYNIRNQSFLIKITQTKSFFIGMIQLQQLRQQFDEQRKIYVQKKQQQTNNHNQPTPEALQYRSFQEKYKEIKLQYIIQKISKSTHKIQINEKQVQVLDSEDRGKAQYQSLSKEFLAEFYLYISIFIITVRVQFVFKKLPFPKGQSDKNGGFGEIFFTKNENGRRFCTKVIRLKNNHFELLHDALQQFGMYKLASALGVGPEVCVINIPDADQKQKTREVDILVFNDGLYFQMEKCDPITQAIPYWNSTWLNKNQKELEDTQRKFEEDLSFKMRLMHRLKLMHRDIKPANVVYSKIKNEFFFIDFGLAHSVKQMSHQRTKIEYFAGTQSYASQELISLWGKCGGKVNLYYNDLFGLQKTINEFGKFFTQQKWVSACSNRPSYKKINLNLNLQKEESDFKMIDKVLLVFKAIFGINRSIENLWRLKVQLQNPQENKKKEEKKIQVYKRQIWKCPHYHQICFFQQQLQKIKKKNPNYKNNQIFNELQKYQQSFRNEKTYCSKEFDFFLMREMFYKDQGYINIFGHHKRNQTEDKYFLFLYDTYRLLIFQRAFYGFVSELAQIVDKEESFQNQSTRSLKNSLKQKAQLIKKINSVSPPIRQFTDVFFGNKNQDPQRLAFEIYRFFLSIFRNPKSIYKYVPFLLDKPSK